MIVLTVLLITVSIMARIIVPFPGWDRLKTEAPNIIIARCGKPTPPTPDVIIMNAPTSDSAIEVVSVLKGINNASSSRLLTDHGLRQDENYLIIGHYDSGIYRAHEEYHVIPLGVNFSTNLIAGKPLDALWQEYVDRGIIDDERDWQKWFKCTDIDPTTLAGAEVNRLRMKGYALLFASRLCKRPVATYRLLRTFGRHMKAADMLTLLASPFRRRKLTRQPELPARMLDAGIAEPLRNRDSARATTLPLAPGPQVTG